MNKFFDKAKESLFPQQMPTWDGFLVYVLRYLDDGNVRSLRDIRKSVADLAGLTAAQRSEKLPSGQLRAENRIGWAVSYLTRVGALDRPARAQYRITSSGTAILKKHPDAISEEDLKALVKPGDEWWLEKQGGAGDKKTIVETKLLDPMEQIEAGLQRLNADVAADLLQRLQGMEPKFLESVSVQLLVKMGYGGVEGKGTVTPYSHDGGIDGTIDRDPLGIDRVHVQAKRYTSGNSVQAPEVQKFVGALNPQASSGVFITTGKFSQGAHDYARTARPKVILIDGQRLTDLMIKYGVGVQTRQKLDVVAVDEDFFD